MIFIVNISTLFKLIFFDAHFTIEKNLKKYSNDFSGPLAQLVEQFPFKEWVAGSNPARLTIKLSSFNRWIIQNYLIHPSVYIFYSIA